MDVYIASNGALIGLERRLAEYDSYDHLVSNVASATGIPPEHVLLFLEDGTELKEEVLYSAWERGGEGGSSSQSNQAAYVFDRESFFVDAEATAAMNMEDLALPPELPLSALHDVGLIQLPFLQAGDHIQHLEALFRAQSQALSIAYSSLFLHRQPILDEFEQFLPRARLDLDDEGLIVRSVKAYVAMLPRIVVHDAIKTDKDREKDKNTMADHVNLKMMGQLGDSSLASYEGRVKQCEALVVQWEQVVAQSDMERSMAEDRVVQVADEFAEALNHIQLALDQVEALAANGLDSAIQDIMDLDRGMRQDLAGLTGIKNDFTVDLHMHLRRIAHFQTQVVDLAPQIYAMEQSLLSNASSKSSLSHLSRLRKLPLTYATAIIELVRRKEAAQYMEEWAAKLREGLAGYTSAENERRGKVNDDVLKNNPFTVGLLVDTKAVDVKVTVSSGYAVMKNVALGRDDVKGLLKWVDELRRDSAVIGALPKGDPNPVDALQKSVEALAADIDSRENDLQRILFESLVAKSGEGDRGPVELQKAHERYIKELKDQQEARENTFQQRQAELQDELVRLRTDLAEEMIAREALSAQLDETTREREDKQREQDDCHDLVAGLQAEVSQEKDRATDLGVRLQEALLDIDGLRTAEQSLLSQLQGLQEERSASIQAQSEAETRENNLKSELAGLKAELEATNSQLAKARVERDTALRNQSAEAERLMRDHIAEADGDRAVLEHQNLTLSKQIEDLRVEMADKLSAAKNASVRQADGLKAELQFTKAQLRSAQQKEAVMADELAMARDTAASVSRQTAQVGDISREAVQLARAYHDTCQRLMNAINASSTISGYAAASLASKASLYNPARSASHSHSASASASIAGDEMRESALLKSLSPAQQFDLEAFAEAVQKTINLVKKWGKSCKTYRDLSRNRLAFTNFGKGDLALFLPTRNTTANSWACFNVSAPHNFLKVDPALQAQIANREWLIARITSTEESVASGGQSPETNPFGLADGLRYWVHTVEEYNPTAPRPSRRSTSASFYKSPDELNTSQTVSSSRKSSHTNQSRGRIESTSPLSLIKPTAETGYFPPMPEGPVEDPQEEIEASAADDSSPQSATTPAILSTPDEPAVVPDKDVGGASAPIEAPKLSPVAESLSTSRLVTTRSSATLGPALEISAKPDASATPSDTGSRPRSRNATAVVNPMSSPPSRGSGTRRFAPSMFGRPASIASNASYPGNAPFAAGTGKASAATAVVTSTSTTSTPAATATEEGSELDPFAAMRSKRVSSTHSIPRVDAGSPDVSSAAPGSSSGSGFQSLGLGPPPAPSSPLGKSPEFGDQGSGSSPVGAASRLIKGLSIRRRSGLGETSSSGDPKQSAVDILRKFDNSNSANSPRE